MSDYAKEPCQACGKLFDPIEDLIWVDRALTVCYCEDCFNILYPEKES